MAKSIKTKLIAMIVLGVTTLGFAAGFFTVLGINLTTGPEIIYVPGEDPVVFDPIIADQDIHVEGTYNKLFDTRSEQIYFLVPFEEYYHYRIEVSRTIPSWSFIRPNSVRFIAEYIRDNVDDPNDDEMVIMGILSFVQDRGDNNASMHYVYDSEILGSSKFPIEFFVEGGGDCEDASIAFQSLAQALGYETIICFSPGHCFAAIKMDEPPVEKGGSIYDPFFIQIDGDFYYTCEGTGYGWMIGQLPGSIDPAVIEWELTY